MKKLFNYNNEGFSLMEMLIATTLTVLVSSAAYKVLSSLGAVQKTTVTSQKKDSRTLSALDRFKKDISLVDPNWVTFNVASIYPHQGFGLGYNFYLNPSFQDQGLSDAITFLTRSTEKSRLNSTFSPMSYTPGGGDAQPVFNSLIQLAESETSAEVGDWVLFYESGKYVLGIVDQIEPGAQVKIRIQKPMAANIQGTQPNSSSISSGFVTKPGVVPASYDWDMTNTSSATDNKIAFAKGAKMQVVVPVTYEIDWMTNDGESFSSGSNTFLSDDEGNARRAVVRTSYEASGKKREYLAETDLMGITYDVLKSSSSEKEVIHDVGRQINSEIKFVNVASSASDAGGLAPSSHILSLRMFLGKDMNEEDSSNKKFKEVKVAIDPNLKDIGGDGTTHVASSLTSNLKVTPKTAPGSVFNEQTGKPLYLVNTSSSEVMVPLSSFEMTSGGTLGPNSVGEIYVYDPAGCALNATTGCDPSPQSKIKFNTALTGGTFFPNTIVMTTLPDGTRKIIIGGVSITSVAGGGKAGGPPTITRTPGLGTITLLPNENLHDKLLTPTGGSCNIPGCEWHSINNKSSGLEKFMDTANIAVDSTNPDRIYISPMTKSAGGISPSTLFKGDWNTATNTYDFSSIAGVSGSDANRVVTAISDRTIHSVTGNADYVAVCLSKKISSACSGFGHQECLPPGDGGGGVIPLDDPNNAYGEIQLIPVAGVTTTNPVVHLAQHNYRCSSLNVDNNNNLIVGGRLTVQSIPFNDMENTISGTPSERFMYLDEVVSEDSGTLSYADYFGVDPDSYGGTGRGQFIGWLTGLSATRFPDGSFGMVDANKFRLAANFSENTSAVDKDFSNAGIFKGSSSGSADLVVATIQTDASNLNASIVSVSYTAGTPGTTPEMSIPGLFYTKKDSTRTTPTPLPAMSPSMSDESWIQLYQDLMTPHDASGLNANMPVFGGDMIKITECTKTKPQTCPN